MKRINGNRKLAIFALATALTLPVGAVAQDDKVSETAENADKADGDKADGDEAAESEGEDEAPAFPLHANIGLSNSWSTAWFGKNYGFGTAGFDGTAVPDWNTSLSLGGSYSLPKIDWLPNTMISAGMGVSTQWISNYYQGVYDRIPRVSDFNVGVGMPRIYTEETTGIGVGGNLGVRLPLSLGSRVQNLVAGFALSGNIGWSTKKLDLPFGTFNVGYAPNVSVNAYNTNAPTVACSDPGDQSYNIQLRPTGDPAQSLANLPIVLPRQGEYAGNGECIRPGRQTLGAVGQTGFAGWSLGKHSVSLSLTWINALLRPVSDNPELVGAFASGQNFTEASAGDLSYSYSIPMEALDLPIETNASLSAGLSSGQPAWTMDGKYLRFPFWDFISPANGFSSAYVNLSVGL